MTAYIPNRRLRIAMLALLSGMPGLAQQSTSYDLSQASLEDLMNIQVTSVSKKEQNLSKTAAAIFVIAQEDIRRSGANNIPDLLRMVPGVSVARIDANNWAISIRGFSGEYPNKVLVLIDGRSVYDPGFSGVYWDTVDVPLEDIDRIEVIRGPGGTIWGANAVNGVINIITMKASATPGGLISAGGGSEDHANTLFQYGGRSGSEGAYRVFGKFFDVGNSVFPNGQQAADGWVSGHAGFRSDWTLSQRDILTVEGDFARTAESETITSVIVNELPLVKTLIDPLRSTQGNLLGHWNRTLADGSQISLQVYDSYTRRLGLGFLASQNTVDLDFQYRLAIGSRNDLVWGLGSRVIESAYGEGYDLTSSPRHRLDRLFSGFLQDELKLTRSLSLMMGTKFEHNDFTGSEFQPSAQLVWTPSSKQTLWLSAARALREPSAADVGSMIVEGVIPYGASFGLLQAHGNPNIRAEDLRDFEVGYRALPNKRVTLDVTAFGGLYRNLESSAPQTPYFATNDGISYTVLPQLLVNGAAAHTYGAEFFANWKMTDHWRVSPGYSYFHMNLKGERSLDSPGLSPNHQFQVKSLLGLPHHLDWDNALGYVGKLATGNIPAYVRLDSRLGWRIGESTDLSVVGQNLLSPRHAEFSQPLYPIHATLVQRSFFARLTWRF